MEDMIASFDNKNPQIKAESALFLARALCQTQPAAFNKKLIKAYVASLLKLLESAGNSAFLFLRPHQSNYVMFLHPAKDYHVLRKNVLV